MHILFIFISLLLSTCYAARTRLPKIYNALITSDQNLSPSQAFPILEPVLRTTALGLAFPPIVHATHELQTDQKKESANREPQPDGPEVEKYGRKPLPQLAYHGSLYPLAYEPYSYDYQRDFLYPTLPYYQHPVYVELDQYENNKNNNNRKAENDGPPVPQSAINFKKNPEIPDVLPPLPVKIERKGNS